MSKKARHKRWLNASTESDSRLLELGGTVDLQSTPSKEDGKEDEEVKIKMVANSGIPMRANFPDPVVVDLSGARFDKKRTPIIMDHDTTRRLGYTTAQEIGADIIAADGIITSKSQEAQEFVKDAKSGFPFQVSVGSQVLAMDHVEKGEVAEVNGRSYRGPLLVARKSVVRELSVCVLGADNGTSADISASYTEDKIMDFETFVTSLGFQMSDLTDDQKTKLKAQWAGLPDAQEEPQEPAGEPQTVQASVDPQEFLKAQRVAQAAESRRVGALNAVASRFSSVEKVKLGTTEMTMVEATAQAIEQDWTPDAFELACMRAERPTASTAIHTTPNLADLNVQAISCAALRASGKVPNSQTHKSTGEKWGLEHMYPEKVLEASDHPRLRSVSMHQIMDIICQAAGKPFTGNRKSNEFIQATRESLVDLKAAGFTTNQATNIFDDLANKSMLAGYQSVDTTWQEWAGVRSVNDFKTHNLYRLTSIGAYEQLGADGELKHGSLSDTKYTHSADTYGKIYQLSRKQLINDDMGALTNLMTLLGIEAAKSLEEVAYVLLMGQIGTTWTVGNLNLVSGAANDVSITGLSVAQQTFEDQVDSDDSPIGIQPDRILVGTQDRIAASNLFREGDIREGVGSSATADFFTNNPHVGAYRPIVSGFLNNTAIKQRVTAKGTAIPNQTSTGFFMFGNPGSAQGSTIIISLLNGQRMPTLESADANFEVLGMKWRGYHDFGADVADPILSVHATGAA